jgi:G3E family GTPase
MQQNKEREHDHALTPIPLVVLTGFLGAGKTSWLNRALKHPDLAETLVIINEFGEAGLDHLLIEEAPSEVVLMAAGCLCCSLRADLVSTLEDLLRRRDNRRMPIFRRVVIETTGLSDPLPILQSVLQHPYLSKRFALSGVVTLVDAASGVVTLKAHEAAARQVALADALVITKSDIASPAQVAATHEALHSLNPRLLPVPVEEFTPDTLFTPRFAPMEAGEVERWLGGSDILPNHAGGIESFTFLSEAEVSESALIVFQEAIRVLHGPKLLRLKGIIRVKEHPEEPMVIHHVQSVAHPPQKLARWPGRDRRTRLVFITQGIERAMIEGFWNALARG